MTNTRIVGKGDGVEGVKEEVVKVGDRIRAGDLDVGNRECVGLVAKEVAYVGNQVEEGDGDVALVGTKWALIRQGQRTQIRQILSQTVYYRTAAFSLHLSFCLLRSLYDLLLGAKTSPHC